MEENLLETTTETIKEVEPTKFKLNKFTVIKHKEPIPLTCDSSQWDFNNNSVILNVTSSGGEINTEYSEEEDQFDEHYELKSDNLRNLRDAEGQDTITSMSNKEFLKRMGKKTNSIKVKNSFNNYKPVQQTESQVSLKEIVRDLESMGSNVNCKTSTLSRPHSSTSGSARNLESQTSLHLVNRRESLLHLIKSDALMSTTTLAPDDQQNILVTPRLDELLNVTTTSRKNSVAFQEPSTKSDQVFDVLKEAIETNDKELLDKEFIEQVLVTLKFQQRKDKQHKDNVKKMCRFMELMTFFLIILMTIFLIFNVSQQLQKLHLSSIKSNISRSKF